MRKVIKMNKIAGIDCGTMNIVSAIHLPDNKVKIDMLRNMFLELNPEDMSSNEMSQTNWDYVEQKENGETTKLYIIGEDTFKLANSFGKTVSRPMVKGVISSTEIYSKDVLYLMTEKLIGKTKDGLCVYSIPEQAVDDLNMPPVSYHVKVWDKILESLGYTNCFSLNESQSIIYSECKDSGYTGIALSFGCGLTNCCLCYKGTPTLKFAIARGGDWIDENTAKSIGIDVVTRVTRVKESDLDLLNPSGKNKRETMVKEALVNYYEDLINHILEVFKEQFQKALDCLDIDDEIPIIISGGTSKPKGFLDLFTTVFKKIKDFPYSISEIKMASDPMTAVARGCLIYALWKANKKEEKKNE